VAQFLIATFHSERVSRSGDGYDVVGNLTLHGITKSVVLHMDAPSKDQIGPDGNAHRGFSATTTLHRQDFGLVWNGTMKSGDNILGDDVKMTFEIEAGQK
jgi:polyisoprenoid-binding protein YceI